MWCLSCTRPSEPPSSPGVGGVMRGRGARGAWEVREVQRRIGFHAPYGNCVVGAGDAKIAVTLTGECVRAEWGAAW